MFVLMGLLMYWIFDIEDEEWKEIAAEGTVLSLFRSSPHWLSTFHRKPCPVHEWMIIAFWL